MERNEYFILIACEESQRVTKAFHDLGFVNTFSCDIVEPSGDMPDFHIVVTPVFSWTDMNNGSKDRSILAPHFAREMALQWGVFLEQNERYNSHLETRGIKWN